MPRDALCDESLQAIAVDVLRERYTAPGENGVAQVRARVAAALADAEAPAARGHYRERFAHALEAGFIPGGRIHAGAGLHAQCTLINCFVQPVGDRLPDAAGGPDVFTALEQAALTMRCGGGVGYNFSRLRPRGALGFAPGERAEGPLFYLRLFDDRCRELTGTGSRRGAQMGVLNVEHPDIFDFIAAKQRPHQFDTFNFSVAVSDRFMQALQRDARYELIHAAEPAPEQIAAGARRAADGSWIYRSVRARDVWDALTRAAYAAAEPGVLFLDSINRANNLFYCETIDATNPCGEQPLPDYGCCCLGSMNLAAFVRDPFTPAARFDTAALVEVAGTAVRMLDNVLDITPWPLAEQRCEGLSKRRVGLGVTGLGDALIMLNLRYDDAAARRRAARLLATIRNTAYAASVALARERGCFPRFEARAYLQSRFVAALPPALRAAIARHGIRNSHLISIAPAGTISLVFADNVSNGIEPPFAWRYRRRHVGVEGAARDYTVEDHAFRLYRRARGAADPLPPAFRRAWDIDAIDHVRMLAALTRFVDAGISKTVNVPADCPFDDYQALYLAAWQLGLKGIATFRPNPVSGAVLMEEEGEAGAGQCGTARCTR